MSTQDLQREALRQSYLLRALWRCGGEGDGEGWLRETDTRARQGMAAYRSNAAAMAERALGAAFPTVQQLVGSESFAQLARAYWHHQPPQCGDLAAYGEALPQWIAGDAQLAGEPYLADVARIDWAAHRIEHATDTAVPPTGLERLAAYEPSLLQLRLRPGMAMVPSPWPVVTLWQAHRQPEHDDRFAPVRAAFARGDGETALIFRPHWRAEVAAIDAPTRRFFDSLLRGGALAHALDAAGDDFPFERWLQQALEQHWLQAIETQAEAG